MSSIANISPEQLPQLPANAHRVDVREPEELEGLLGRLQERSGSERLVRRVTDLLAVEDGQR